MSDSTAATQGREHLAERVRPLLDSSDENRISFVHAERWIPYPRADRILSLLEDLLVMPRTHRMPNLLVVGDTNNGKTAVLKRFERLHPCVENARGDGNDMPVVYIQAPPVPDEGRLYNNILTAVRAPFRTNDRVDEKQRIVLRMIRRLEVRVLLIDEIHHIVAGHLTKQHQFRNLLKYLGNELQIPIVAAGTRDSFNALNTDPQLANRFTPALLPLWESGRDWDRLVLSFERRLPLQKPSQLAQNSSATLLEMTEGAIGELSRLLNAAAVEAIRSGRERIDKTLLSGLGWIRPSQRKYGGGDAAAP
jgi:hypothetical protein